MAAEANPQNAISRSFVGAVQAPRAIAGAMMAELLHVRQVQVGVHQHQRAYFAMVLSGGYEEPGRGGRLQFSPFTTGFNPAGVKHDGFTSKHGVRFFTIELVGRWAQEALELGLADPVADMRGTGFTIPLLRLFHEYRAGDHFSSLAAESLLYELLAEAAGLQYRQPESSRWMARVEDCLHHATGEAPALSDLAQLAGVHPVHLVRTFRRTHGQTMGEYQHKLRVRRSCELLSGGEPLADVAARCGFSDQSHYTRIFRRYTGTTPLAMRQALRRGA